MQTVYFDWSHRTGVTTFGEEDKLLVVYPTLDELLDDLNEPTRLIGEATFESFNIGRRKAFMDRCDREGHELLTTPNRLTGRGRRRFGYPEKTDENDVHVIRDLVKAGIHLKRPTLPDPEWVDRREAAAKEIMELRRNGRYLPKPRSRGYAFISDKDSWATELVSKLPPYATLTPTQKLTLGDGKKYSLTVVAAVAVATKYARNVREFDRLAGLYSHAYGSQIRADLHHYGWSGGNQRSKLNTEGKRDDLSLRDWRRELRWLYHQLRELV